MDPTTPLGRLTIALASLRASQWLHFCVLPLAALRAEDLFALPSTWVRTLIACLVAAGCLGFAYGLNAVVERHTDRSEAKNLLVAAPELAPLAAACALAAALFALTLAAVLGPAAVFACGISIVCGAAYSIGITGKRIPVLPLTPKRVLDTLRA